MPIGAGQQAGDDVVQVEVLLDQRIDLVRRWPDSTSDARSITPQVLICEPNIASASVLSPSVTAT